jgi:hypothetical protein
MYDTVAYVSDFRRLRDFGLRSFDFVTFDDYVTFDFVTFDDYVTLDFVTLELQGDFGLS